MYKRDLQRKDWTVQGWLSASWRVENLVAAQFIRLDALVGPIWHQKPRRSLEKSLGIVSTLEGWRISESDGSVSEGDRQGYTFSGIWTTGNCSCCPLRGYVFPNQLSARETLSQTHQNVFPRYSKSNQVDKTITYVLRTFGSRVLLCSAISIYLEFSI